MTAIRIEELEAESFAPFGRIITPPGTSPDATGRGWSWWAEIAPLTGEGRKWGIGYLDLEPVTPQFDWAERHMLTEEAVIATSGDLLVYVAPPEHLDDPPRIPPLDRFRAFRIRAGSGIVLARGVWHGAPLAASERTSALVFILQGTGIHDVTVVRFPHTPVELETGTSLLRGSTPEMSRSGMPRSLANGIRKE